MRGKCGQPLLQGRPLELTDANANLSRRFGIRNIPTLVRLQGEVETARQSGAVPAGVILALAGVRARGSGSGYETQADQNFGVVVEHLGAVR